MVEQWPVAPLIRVRFPLATPLCLSLYYSAIILKLMNYFLIVIFFAGILQDFLFTLSLRYVSKEIPHKAAIMAFFDNAVSVGVIYSIIKKLDDERTLFAIIIYSLGIATGTYLAMKLKINRSN